MDFIRAFFQTQHHPISELLLLWANKTSLIDEYSKNLDIDQLFQFPTLVKTRIFALDMTLVAGQSIADSLSSLKEKTSWNLESEIILMNLLLSQAKQSTLFVVASLLNIISFLINTEIQIDDKIHTTIMETLSALHTPDFENHVQIIAKEVFKRVLDSTNLIWTSESTIASFSCLKNHITIVNDNKNMPNTIYDHIPDDLSLEISEKIIDFLLEYNKIQKITYDEILEQPKLVKILELCSSNLYLPCIDLYSQISQTLTQTSQIDHFITLPVIICQQIIKYPSKYSLNFEIPEYIKLKNSSDYDFYEGDKQFFENGFNYTKTKTLLDIEPLQNFIDENLWTLLLDITNLIEEAHISCIRIFLESFATLISTQKSDSFIPCYSFFLYCVSHFSRISSIKDYYFAIFHPLIFNQSLSIFSYIPDFIDTLRSHVFEVVLTTDPTSITSLIKSTQNSELLTAECLARILSHIPQVDFKIFTAETVLRNLASSLKNLQFLRREHPNEFIKAYMSCLSFISKLLSEKQIAELCFTNATFSRNLFGLIYDEDIAEQIIVCICDYLGTNSEMESTYFIINVFESISSTKKSQMGEFFIDQIQRSIERNNSCVLIVDDWIDSMLDFSISNPSQKTLSSCLRIILMLVRQHNSPYKFSAKRLIKIVNSIQLNEGDEPSESVISLLWGIAAQTKSVFTDSMFLIRCSSIIVPVFATMSKFNCQKFLERIKELCFHSPSNCVACHDGGLDLCLLDFLLKGEVNHRGLKFTPNISENEIDSTVFPLIFTILQEKSSKAESSRIINLIIKGNIKMAEYLNMHISQMTNSMKPTFKLCSTESIYKHQGFNPQKLNFSFSFSFYIKIDQSISSLMQPITIFSINSKSTQLSLILNHTSLFFNCNSNIKYSYQCSAALPSNKWILVTFAARKISQTMMAWGLYANTNSSMMSESGNVLSFDNDAVFELGQVADINPALIGRFGFTYDVLTVDNIINILADVDAFKNPKFLFSHTINSANLFVNNSSLDKSIGLGGHLQRLFSMFNKLDDKIGEHVIGIAKLAFSASVLSQRSFKSFAYAAGSLENIDTKRLTYQLYLALFSIGDVITDEKLQEDFIDFIILNAEIWSRATTSTFMRICNHWSHTVLSQYSTLIQRPGFFQRMIKSFSKLFINFEESPAQIYAADSPLLTPTNSPMKSLNDSPIIAKTNESPQKQNTNRESIPSLSESPQKQNQDENSSLSKLIPSDDNSDSNDSPLKPDINENENLTSTTENEENTSLKQNQVNILTTPKANENSQQESNENLVSTPKAEGNSSDQNSLTTPKMDETIPQSLAARPRFRENPKIVRANSVNITGISSVKTSESLERFDDDTMRIRSSFAILLMNSPITSKTEAEFILSLVSFNNPAIRDLLRIVAIHAKEIMKYDITKPKAPECLLDIIRYTDDIETITDTVLTMVYLTPSHISLIAASELVAQKPIAKDVLNTLAPKLPNLSGLAEFLCALSLACAPDSVKEDQVSMQTLVDASPQRKISVGEKIMNKLRIGRSRKVSDVTGSPRRLSFLAAGDTTTMNEVANLYCASFKAMVDVENKEILFAKGGTWPFLPLAMLPRISDIVVVPLISAVAFIISQCENPAQELSDAILTIKIIEFVSQKDLSRHACSLVQQCAKYADSFSATCALFIRALPNNSSLDSLFDDSPFKNEAQNSRSTTIIRNITDLKFKGLFNCTIGAALTETRDIYGELSSLCEGAFSNLAKEISLGSSQIVIPEELSHNFLMKTSQKVSLLMERIDAFNSESQQYLLLSEFGEAQIKKLAVSIQHRLSSKILVDYSVMDDFVDNPLPLLTSSKHKSRKFVVGQSIPHLFAYDRIDQQYCVSSKALFSPPNLTQKFSTPCLLLSGEEKFAAFFITGTDSIIIQQEEFGRTEIPRQSVKLVLTRQPNRLEIFSKSESFLLEFSEMIITQALDAIMEFCPSIDVPPHLLMQKMVDDSPDEFESYVVVTFFQGQSIHSGKLSILGQPIEKYSGISLKPSIEEIKNAMLLRNNILNKQFSGSGPVSHMMNENNISFCRVFQDNAYLMSDHRIVKFHINSHLKEVIEENCNYEQFYVLNNEIFDANFGEYMQCLFFDNSNILVLMNETNLLISHENKQLSLHSMISLSDRVVCASFCSRTAAVSIGLSSCTAILVSTDGKEIFCRADCAKEPRTVFSTGIFSFLCVDTGDEFIAFNHDSSVVFSMKFDTCVCTTFSCNSTDFALLCDSGRVVAVDIVNQRVIDIARERNVVALAFNASRSCIIVINKTGLIHEVPFLPTIM